jgi:hypothetical protein
VYPCQRVAAMRQAFALLRAQIALLSPVERSGGAVARESSAKHDERDERLKPSRGNKSEAGALAGTSVALARRAGWEGAT